MTVNSFWIVKWSEFFFACIDEEKLVRCVGCDLKCTFCYFCSFMAWTHDTVAAPLDGMTGVFLVPGVIMAIAAVFKVGIFNNTFLKDGL